MKTRTVTKKCPWPVLLDTCLPSVPSPSLILSLQMCILSAFFFGKLLRWRNHIMASLAINLNTRCLNNKRDQRFRVLGPTNWNHSWHRGGTPIQRNDLWCSICILGQEICANLSSRMEMWGRIAVGDIRTRYDENLRALPRQIIGLVWYQWSSSWCCVTWMMKLTLNLANECRALGPIVGQSFVGSFSQGSRKKIGTVEPRFNCKAVYTAVPCCPRCFLS